MSQLLHVNEDDNATKAIEMPRVFSENSQVKNKNVTKAKLSVRGHKKIYKFR